MVAQVPGMHVISAFSMFVFKTEKVIRTAIVYVELYASSVSNFSKDQLHQRNISTSD